MGSPIIEPPIIEPPIIEPYIIDLVGGAIYRAPIA